MGNGEEKEVYGFASIESVKQVVAGSFTTVKLAYVVGSAGISSGGHIQIQTDSDTDWELPQFDQPCGADYMTIQAPQSSRLSVMVKDYRTLILTVIGEPLGPGKQIALTCGDKSSGGPGTRAQTFAEKKRYFWVSVDSKGDGNYVTLKGSPFISIVGDRPIRLRVTAPTLLEPDEPFRLVIKAEDKWGNPSPNFQGIVTVQAKGMKIPVSKLTFPRVNDGICTLDGCRCSHCGTYRISVVDKATGLSSRSNPIICREKPLKFRLYWGDPHGGQVKMAEKIADFFRYAQDISDIDFTGYQRNDHDLSSDDWRLQQDAEARFYKPGRFVPLPGVEWSGTTQNGGHHNLYFRRHHQPIRRSDHRGLQDKSDMDKNLPHILDVYRAYRYQDVVITPHVGGYPTDLTYHDPTLEPVIEVTSTHGSFEWFLEDAIERKYKVGFIGGSDGYTGRPGGEYPGYLERRYSKGGYTGLYAEELTIEAVLEAMKARRCYATTGERIIAEITADGHLMGEEYFSKSWPNISGFVAGTAPLETIEIIRGLERIYSHPIPLSYSSNRVRILCEGASAKASFTGVIWDGSLSVNGTNILDVEPIRFDSPRSNICSRSSSAFKWHAVSCGYPSGIIVTVDNEQQAEFEVVVNVSMIRAPDYGGYGNLPPLKMSYYPAERLAIRFNIEELSKGTKEINIGPLKRKLTISMAPEAGTSEIAEFNFEDKSPKPGINPYWMRVKQTNMEMAWTSPVFFDYSGS